MDFDVKTALMPGMQFVVERMLTEEDTAAHYGSKQLGRLIASPAYVGMMIDATVGIVDDRLPEDLLTVGRAMEFTHEAPTSLGMRLRVVATLQEIINDRLFFEIEASDDAGPVGHGTHERVVVSREKLFASADKRLLNR